MSILESFEADCRTRGLANTTTLNYVSCAQKFQEMLERRGKDFRQADRLDVRDYVEELRQRDCITKTVSYNLSAISALYEWLIFEGQIERNPVIEVRKRYMQRYKTDGESQTHKVISIEEAASIVDALVDLRDKTILLLLFKTGIRRGELLSLDVDSVNLNSKSITLKNTKKRTNRTVFFDDETAFYLRRWLAVREGRDGSNGKALFLSTRGGRMSRNAVSYLIRKGALRTGLHDLDSDRMEDHFSAHCCRHWFTTHLRRAGMPREFIQELRGDVRKDAIDIYDHIDREELKKSYLAHIPQLGV